MTLMADRHPSCGWLMMRQDTTIAGVAKNFDEINFHE